jgi:hypothetical protein
VQEQVFEVWNKFKDYAIEPGTGLCTRLKASSKSGQRGFPSSELSPNLANAQASSSDRRSHGEDGAFSTNKDDAEDSSSDSSQTRYKSIRSRRGRLNESDEDEDNFQQRFCGHQHSWGHCLYQ